MSDASDSQEDGTDDATLTFTVRITSRLVELDQVLPHPGWHLTNGAFRRVLDATPALEESGSSLDGSRMLRTSIETAVAHYQQGHSAKAFTPKEWRRWAGNFTKTAGILSAIAAHGPAFPDLGALGQNVLRDSVARNATEMRGEFAQAANFLATVAQAIPQMYRTEVDGRQPAQSPDTFRWRFFLVLANAYLRHGGRNLSVSYDSTALSDPWRGEFHPFVQQVAKEGGLPFSAATLRTFVYEELLPGWRESVQGCGVEPVPDDHLELFWLKETRGARRGP